jgi:hypothetical protein
MFDSLKLFFLTHVTSFGPIAPKLVDFRVLGVKTLLRAQLLRLGEATKPNLSTFLLSSILSICLFFFFANYILSYVKVCVCENEGLIILVK